MIRRSSLLRFQTGGMQFVMPVHAPKWPVYDFKVNDADQKPYDLMQHKGKPFLIYNVASKCGYANSGYETAAILHRRYRDQGFTVLAFPCDQFVMSGTATAEEVKEFASSKFNAEFPIMEKVNVNGSDAHPLYQYLQCSVPGILGTQAIKWNFTSFLVNKDGVPVHRFSPGASASEIERTLLPLFLM